MRYSCGIFIVNKDKNTILLCHPTNYIGDNQWSIPKGGVDKGELFIDTAIRETMEETNLDVSQFRYDLIALKHQTYTNNKKTIVPFLLLISNEYYESIKDTLKCNSFVEEYKGGFPEMDDFKWYDINKLDKIIHRVQMRSLPEIVTVLKTFTK